MPYEYVMSNIVSARNRCEARAVTVAMRDPRVDRGSSTRTLKAQQVSGSVQQVQHLNHTHTHTHTCSRTTLHTIQYMCVFKRASRREYPHIARLSFIFDNRSVLNVHNYSLLTACRLKNTSCSMCYSQNILTVLKNLKNSKFEMK